MIESNRFDLPHASAYAVVIIFILGLFLLDKLSMWFFFRDGHGFFQKLVLLPTGYLFVKCSTSKEFALSNNLYADISAEALQKEYEETAELFRNKTVEYSTLSA